MKLLIELQRSQKFHCRISPKKLQMNMIKKYLKKYTHISEERQKTIHDLCKNSIKV